MNWIHAKGNYFTPGGDPLWQCPVCGSGLHVYGVEEEGLPGAKKDRCPDCGQELKYPWEDDSLMPTGFSCGVA